MSNKNFAVAVNSDQVTELYRLKDLHYAFLLSIIGIPATDERGNAVVMYPTPDEAVSYICGGIPLNQIHGKTEDFAGLEDEEEEVEELVNEQPVYTLFDFMEGEWEHV